MEHVRRRTVSDWPLESRDPSHGDFGSPFVRRNARLFLLLLVSTLLSAAGYAIPTRDAAAQSPAKPRLGSPMEGVRWGFLSNGTGYLIIENHAAPMVGASAVVHAGAGLEDWSTQGASHFLEHLLFNGTETRTQEEIYDTMDLLGTYNNASTRATHVVFMILAASDKFWQAFDVQQDMLFASTLPPDKLEKERGIILEELARSQVSSDVELDRLLQLDVFGPQGYGLPTLGSETTISTLQRDQILRFYETHYVPNRMTWILTGALDAEAAIDSLEATVGSVPARSVEGVATGPGLGLAARQVRVDRSAPTRRVHWHDVDSPMVQWAWMGPDPASPRYEAFRARFELQVAGTASPLRRALEDAFGTLTEFAPALSEYPGGSVLTLRVGFATREDADAALASLPRLAGQAFRAPPSEAEVRGWKRREETSEIYLREKPHYYGIFRGDRLAARGLPALAHYLQMLAELSPADVAAAELPLSSEPFRISIVLPHPMEAASPATMEGGDEPASPHGDGGAASTSPHGGGEASTSPHGHAGATPSTSPHGHGEEPTSDDASGRAGAAYGEWTLPNGARVAAFSSPESEVLAVHLFIRGRSEREPEDHAGIAELLHSMLGRATESQDAEAFALALDEIGAELKTADSPFIPYDDFYSVPQFSFVRFQSLDRFAPDAFALLQAMLARPRVEPDAFESAKNGLLSRVQRDEGSSRHVAMQRLEAELGRAPARASVFGTSASIDNISFEDLQAFAASYLDPSSYHFVVASGLPLERLREMTGRTLGELPTVDDPWAAPAGEPTAGDVDVLARIRDMEAAGASAPEWIAPAAAERFAVAAEDVGTEQSYVVLVRVFQAPDDLRATLRVTNGVLSDRIAFQLREREGLAYSIGSSVRDVGSGTWIWTAAAGTRPENVARVSEGFAKAVEEVLADAPEMHEVQKTAASIYGRGLMRRVTRLNLCYYAGLSLLDGEDPRQIEARERALERVAPAGVIDALATYWQDSPGLLVVAR